MPPDHFNGYMALKETMPNASQPTSMRARLAQRRAAFAGDEGAQSNPIQEVGVGFILISIALVIALTILPTITSAVNTAQSDANVSSTDSTLLGLLPTLLIVGLLAGGVVFLIRGFRGVRNQR